MSNKGIPKVLSGTEFRLAAKWWLGLPVCAPQPDTTCTLCGEAADAFGDHWLCCSSSLITKRHNELRDTLASFLREHSFPCATEVTIGSKERPADIALDGFDSRPLAIDLTISHPLKPSQSRDLELAQKYLHRKEESKINKYSTLCASAGWVFQPVAFHPWGGSGPMTKAFLDRLTRRVAGDRTGFSRSLLISSFWQQMGSCLMKSIVHQLQTGVSALEASIPLPTNTLPLVALPRHPHVQEEPLLDLAGNLLPAALPELPVGDRSTPIPLASSPALQHGPLTIQPRHTKRTRT